MKVLGHRGNKTEFTENTLEGFESVIADNKIDGFEFDIVVSKDKKLVVSHDYYLIDQENKKQMLYNLTYEEIVALGNVNLVKQEKPGTLYPQLEDVLSLVASREYRKQILLEIKSIPSVTTLVPLSIKELIKEVHKLIKKYSLEEIVNIISFDYRVIEESKRQNSNIKTGMILHRNLIPIELLVKPLQVSFVVAEKNWIIKEQIQKLSLCDIDVYVWTPNSKKEFLRLQELGVAGIITDTPKNLTI